MKPLIAILALALLAPAAAVAQTAGYLPSGPCRRVCGRPDGLAPLLGRLGWPRGSLLASLVERGMSEEDVSRLLSPYPGIVGGMYTTGMLLHQCWVLYEPGVTAPWLTVTFRSDPKRGMRVSGVDLRGPLGPGPDER